MKELLARFNDIEAQKEFSSQDLNRDTKLLFSTLPYLIPVFFFLPLLINKQSSFCRFHANQQLAWLIVCVPISIVCSILRFIPLLGSLINSIVGIVTFIVSVILFVAALNGYAIRIPVIGEKINLF